MEYLEQELQYRFQNRKLLERALCHRSFANEHRDGSLENNERLEFLGDSVLGFVAADYLYRRWPDLPEGRLTRIRAKMVREESLRDAAKRLDLGRYLRLGRGEEENGGQEKPSILADAVEAVIAAVYLDGGISAAKTLVKRIILDFFSDADILEEAPDYKSALQELAQRKPEQELRYRILDERGPCHEKIFTVEALIDGERYGLGEGHSKKEAEQAAAGAALLKLRDKDKKVL